MADDFAGMAAHYDAIISSGYYDHARYAGAILASIGDRRDLLELGVGTGLVCEKILRLDPSLRVTGVDSSESMIAQARNRLGDRVGLLLQDIRHLHAPAAFDVAFSVGGVWAYTRGDRGNALAGHLVDDDDNVAALRNVYTSLRAEGILLIAVQQSHSDGERPLPGGLRYVQKVLPMPGRRIVKNYYILSGDEIIAHQCCEFRMWQEDNAKRLLEQCGFRFDRVTGDGLFYQFSRL